MNDERRKQLLQKIEQWEKELNDVWKDTNTDAAEVERRNLRNLINNARREIDEIDGNVQDSLEEINPEELLENLKNKESSIEATKNRLKLSIERLKEERKDYTDNKNLYDEYSKKINEVQKELEDLEKKENNLEEKDKNLKILTKGRMNEEKNRKEIENQIRKKQQEISEIEYDTENAMEEIELSSGEKIKQPKVLGLYKELDALRAQLNEKDSKIKEYQDAIDTLKGIDKEKSKQNHELTSDEIRYFHGQGDLREYGGENGEDTRKNRLDNDEYFGIRGEKGRTSRDPVPPQPIPPQPVPPQPIPPQLVPLQPVPPVPTPMPPGVQIEKSGLQIFREQFNKMPEIEKRHTLSERFDIVMPMGMPAAAALSAFVNPFLGIPVLAGSVAAKPIIYRATGQKKLEKQITEQFLNMDEGEFNKMVDYLSEERQIDLKPNAVILNALHKAVLKKTKESKVKLDTELKTLKDERDSILEKDGEYITEEENERLGQINKRIISICDYTTDSTGKRGLSESEIISKRLKEVRRGKDRLSAKYKRNLASRFNIFAHRNSTTKEYSGAINEYADEEFDRDVAIAKNNNVNAARHQKNMDKVLTDNTFTNGLGIQKSVFNARKGAVRIISDAKDRSVRLLATILTAGIGLTKFGIEKAKADQVQSANKQKLAQIQNQHNRDVNNIHQATGKINGNEMQSAADANVTEYGTAVEHGNLNKHGDFTQQYHIDDMQAQKDVVNMSNGSQISGNTAGEKLHSLADIIRSKTTAAQELANSTQNPIMSGATLKAHGPLLGYEHDYASQVASEASVVDKCADVMDIAEKMQLSSGQLDNASISWTGPIITALSGFIGRIKDAKKDKKTIKENREIEEEQI